MTPARSPGLSLAALVTLGLLAVAHPAHANTNIVANSGFDAPNLGGGYYYNINATSVTPWDFRGNSGVINPPSGFDSNGNPVYAPSPNQYAFIQSNSPLGGSGQAGIFSQTLNLTAGTTYNLSFLYAGRNGNGYPSYDGAANDLVSLDGNSGQGTVFSQNFSTASDKGFKNFAGSFTTTATQAGAYTLAFSNTSLLTSGGDHTSFIDNVDVSAAPEPSQLAGLAFTGFGALGLILKTRKRKASEVTA